ncbi:hypothetical protein BHM03_00063031 [Ensete ventricosum]|nr:hypothetical protein BHM03_00063031 [Ensete ventricosum]
MEMSAFRGTTHYSRLYKLRLLQSSPNKVLQQPAADDVLPEISVAALLEAEGERDMLTVGCTTEHSSEPKGFTCEDEGVDASDASLRSALPPPSASKASPSH